MKTHEPGVPLELPSPAMAPAGNTTAAPAPQQAAPAPQAPPRAAPSPAINVAPPARNVERMEK